MRGAQMRIQPILVAFFLFGLSQSPSVHAAGACGDKVLCISNPPYPPDPPFCRKYSNVCSFVEPGLTQPESREPQLAPKPTYSIQLDNLSKDQLEQILDRLGIDKSKAKLPQQP
jgi:hypothetical protein